MTMSEKIQSSLDALREDVRDLKDHVRGLVRRKKDPVEAPPDHETALAQWTWPGWPQVDVEETDDRFFVTVDLPGLTKEDVEVHVDRDRLMLIASHEATRENDEDGWIRRERVSGSFARTRSSNPSAAPAATSTTDLKSWMLMLPTCTSCLTRLCILIPKAQAGL